MVLLAGDRGEVTLGTAMISDEVVQDIARAVLEIAGRDGVVAEEEDESSFTE
jgi:hypothetical protein